MESGVKRAIKLNQASRPSGRPKQRKLQKAKRKKEIEDTLAFVDTAVNVGDVKLEEFDEIVLTNSLSVEVVGGALDGISSYVRWSCVQATKNIRDKRRSYVSHSNKRPPRAPRGSQERGDPRGACQ
ncbi:hypothetical protein F442_10917 [Phytophthora nicotianae P10297]|uniref:Uncharacterized protein n=1 Tax=Phytophthora nicotianae P10297 TaxID=1317064 RepID=W2Z5C4_PHYNI|nr:hypothetical protein F442_10917 [Phytophthora nicotianae P10297]